jgi:FkbM family methyltransferase
MTVYHEEDLNRLNWFGFKTLVSSIVLFSPVNAVIRWFARRLLSQSDALRIPVSLSEVHCRLQNGASLIMLDPGRDEIARNLFWGDGRPASAVDRQFLSVVENMCRHSNTFLDVGAYSGFYSLVAARTNLELMAVAFEIVPENYQLIVRNIIHNDLVGRVDARLCGLSDQTGWMTVAPALNLDRLASSISLGSNFRKGVQIPLTTLDLATANMRGPFAMKIDVEGFESKVFCGGRQFLERQRPEILCEILPGAQNVARIEALLGSLGYRFALVTEDGLRTVCSIRPEDRWRDWLFSANPEMIPA